MFSTNLPTSPYEKVGSDLFEIQGQKYIVIVDYYSNYFEFFKLTNATTSNIIKIFKENFSRYGIPKLLITDNGAQYTSEAFKIFADTY